MAKIMDAWEASRVTRKHTMINIRAENIAEHSWGVLHILLCVWPTAPGKLVIATHYHDVGEFKTGDVPAHVKWDNPDVRQTCERLEREGAELCLPEALHHCLNLIPPERFLIEICDKAEFCFSCYYEIMLGNRHVVKAFLRSYNRVQRILEDHSAEIYEMHGPLSVGLAALMSELTLMSTKIGDPI